MRVVVTVDVDVGSVFLFIAILAMLKLTIEESQRQFWWLRLAHGLLFAAFILIAHPFTLEISRLWVDQQLNSPLRLNDATLVVLVDLLLVLLAMTARDVRWPNSRRIRYYGPLRVAYQLMHKLVYYLPPLLAFPALFYLRLALLFSLPGVSFTHVTLLMAGFVLFLSLASPLFCRGLRLNGEAAILLSMVTLAVVVVAALFAPQSRIVPFSPGDHFTLLRHTAFLTLALGVGVLIGYLVFRLADRSRR